MILLSTEIKIKIRLDKLKKFRLRIIKDYEKKSKIKLLKKIQGRVY